MTSAINTLASVNAEISTLSLDISILKDELEHQPNFQTQGWKRLIEETPGLMDRIQAKKDADEAALESKRKALIGAQAKKTAVRQEVGTSLLESVKATQLALADILQHADIRADFALLGLALDDAYGALSDARSYYQTLVELTNMEGVAPAATDRLAVSVPNVADRAPAKAKAFPEELSQYVSRSKEGFHLAALVSHYREAMIQLLLENQMHYDKAATVLAAKGLNGGTFTGAQLRALIYQTGLHKELPSPSSQADGSSDELSGKNGFPLMGARGKVFCCPHRTQTVRKYLAEEIGLDVLAERCSDMFSSGFHVTRGPDGATLVLKNQTMDKLLALPLLVSRRTGHAVPRWVH